MFGRGGLSRTGIVAQALVLDKRVYASGTLTGRSYLCRYRLRVRFEDGSTTEVSRWVWGRKLSGSAVGDLVPMRYDAADRSRMAIDGPAVLAKRAELKREQQEQAIRRGERNLDES